MALMCKIAISKITNPIHPVLRHQSRSQVSIETKLEEYCIFCTENQKWLWNNVWINDFPKNKSIDISPNFTH